MGPSGDFPSLECGASGPAVAGGRVIVSGEPTQELPPTPTIPCRWHVPTAREWQGRCVGVLPNRGQPGEAANSLALGVRPAQA